MINNIISDREFSRCQAFIYNTSGISIGSNKKALVSNRLSKRLRHLKIESYKKYFDMALNGGCQKEKQIIIDLLTTNETYFFREPGHFDFLTA